MTQLFRVRRETLHLKVQCSVPAYTTYLGDFPWPGTVLTVSLVKSSLQLCGKGLSSHPHFTSEEGETDLRNLPEVTHLVRGRAGTWTPLLELVLCAAHETMRMSEFQLSFKDVRSEYLLCWALWRQHWERQPSLTHRAAFPGRPLLSSFSHHGPSIPLQPHPHTLQFWLSPTFVNILYLSPNRLPLVSDVCYHVLPQE